MKGELEGVTDHRSYDVCRTQARYSCIEFDTTVAQNHDSVCEIAQFVETMGYVDDGESPVGELPKAIEEQGCLSGSQ